ncbi:outer membrane protein TolC [Flavobacterium croceum DSM 17960]|uniref:Outer membrane protein TolC n=1 Tax=Flavobacterium croceum DSM 17960 TaxID=1121886 RepID=A0A2S4N801_9FLAO|nr:TolC family protein [Flavobacterium croceum]POS01493.1 outer membrane protein TolC [Flavobacterium croceum DSM 17960]
MKFIKHILYFILFFFVSYCWSQESNNKEFTLQEFLAIVKKHHPLIKSANLEINTAEAKLLVARGAFDPKIEVDFDKKVFKEKEYFSLLNSSFKIPTWYGIELKAALEKNEGYYINPQNLVPEQGLAAVGINIPVLQGLLINQRMADLRKAKIQVKLSQNEQKLEAVNVLYNATVAYCNWKKNYDENVLYTKYYSNALLRYNAIKKLIEQGDKAAIDSIEAEISVENRKLNLEDSNLKLTKAKLELSNFLWIDNIPLELQDQFIPENKLNSTIESVLETQKNEISVENHPKILAINQKIDMLSIDKKLAQNQLLPKLNIGYSLLNDYGNFGNPNYKDYKLGLNVAVPLFLRKERGYAKLAEIKWNEQKLNFDIEKLQLENKFKSQKAEIISLKTQNTIAQNLMKSNETLLQAEERLFAAGESSLFLINTRENNTISASINKINLENRMFISFAELYKLNAQP